MDVGDRGHRHWIMDGCKYYARLLKENDISIDLVTHGGDNHEHELKDRMERFMFPWFSEHLVSE